EWKSYLQVPGALFQTGRDARHKHGAVRRSGLQVATVGFMSEQGGLGLLGFSAKGAPVFDDDLHHVIEQGRFDLTQLARAAALAWPPHQPIEDGQSQGWV